MAADKKPVWVDEDAHRILKAWAKILKRPMVEVASELVLEKLETLDPSAGLVAQAAEATAEPEPAATRGDEPAAEAPEHKETAAPVAATERESAAAEPVETEPAEEEGSAARAQATADAPAEAEVTSVDHSATHGVEPIPTSSESKLRYFGGVHLVR